MIDIRFNGSPFGSGTTGIDGDYLITGMIPTEGTFTLTADYAGETRAGLTLLPSQATFPVGTAISSGGLLVGAGILLLLLAQRK